MAGCILSQAGTAQPRVALARVQLTFYSVLMLCLLSAVDVLFGNKALSSQCS